MQKPDLAGAGRGLELWRMLIRENEAPEQTLVQREVLKKWSYPRRCKDMGELRTRLPQWELWGRELETGGRTLDDELKVFLVV